MLMLRLRGTRYSSHSSDNLLRHSRHLLRIIQMCHYFLMGIMLSRQSGSLHQMCTSGGDLRKLTLCCKTNGRKLIFRYSSHYGRRRGRCSVHGRARLRQGDTRSMRVEGRWTSSFSSRTSSAAGASRVRFAQREHKSQQCPGTRVLQRHGCELASGRNAVSSFGSQPSNSRGSMKVCRASEQSFLQSGNYFGWTIVDEFFELLNSWNTHSPSLLRAPHIVCLSLVDSCCLKGEEADTKSCKI